MKEVFHREAHVAKSMLARRKKACFNVGMQKSEAIQLLGGSIKGAAEQIGITTQAIGGWPDVLTPAIRDRVQAALWRKAIQELPESKADDEQEVRPVAHREDLAGFDLDAAIATKAHGQDEQA